MDPGFANLDLAIEIETSWARLFVGEYRTVDADVEFAVAGHFRVSINALFLVRTVENASIDLMTNIVVDHRWFFGRQFEQDTGGECFASRFLSSVERGRFGFQADGGARFLGRQLGDAGF
jgi:hypothetical protein